MPIHHLGSRYSRWDGTQQISPLDADELMRAMSDDLMQNGDLDLALQRLFRWGFERPDGEHVPGLRELMQRLKERRQEQLNRYDLGSILDDVKERLQQVLDTERSGIERRLEEAAGSGQDPAAGQQRGEPSGQEPGAENEQPGRAAEASGEAAQRGEMGRGRGQSKAEPGQQGQQGHPAGG